MRRLILAFAIVAPILLIAFWNVSPILAIAILAVSHALLLYPTLRPNVQWLGPVVTRFEPRGQEVWLTIDDGPAADTVPLLETLASRGVTATFFVKGALAEGSPDLMREIVRRGHSVANHSQTHPSATFWCLPPRRIAGEIDACNRALAAITGSTPQWFRAPVGMKNPFVHPLLAGRGMQLIGWSARAFDTVVGDVERVRAAIARAVSPGAIVLMHQGQPTSVACIDAVIADLKQRGYEFVVPEAGRLKTKR